MADKNIQMTQRNASNTGWDNLYPITKASNVQVTPISGLSGTDVQTVLQNLFQFANDGKTAVANAITAKGVSASPTETFASLASKIGQISTGKKWASGTATSYNSGGSYFVDVNGLSFTPNLVIVHRVGALLYEKFTIIDNYTNVKAVVWISSGGNYAYSYGDANSNTFITSNLGGSPGFRCQVSDSGASYSWVAIE